MTAKANNTSDLVQLPDVKGATEVHVTLNGDTLMGTPETALALAEELFKRHGGGIPKFLYWGPASAQSAPKSEPPPDPQVTLTNIVPIKKDASSDPVSTSGKIRSMIDFAEAEAAGFAPQQSIYERGTKVVELGVKNARRSRQQWEKMPLVDDYTSEFVERIEAEKREDESVDAYALRMTKDGRVGIPDVDRAKLITPVAFQGLTTRLGYGGASYLAKCKPELRQGNFNSWGATLSREREEKRAEAALQGGTVDEGNLVLRTREGKDAREIFGVVTDSYTSFDVDKVAKAFGLALQGLGARGRVTYDGNKARFEAIFHSNTNPEDYVAGEFFKAGIIVRTDDTGGGSLRGNAILFENLCLNLLIIDKASQPLFRIRHIGSIEELVRRFQLGIEAGKEKLGHFLKAWGFACKDDVLIAARKVDEEIPMKISEALPGLFRGILDRELVPMKGRMEENVKTLVSMYEKDTSAARRDDYITRAAIVHAFTRAAHEAQEDPWQEDVIEQAASALVWDKKPLPWLPEPKKAA
jgi:antitoxin component of RelBE/YafQ-DinJ toxin-antitoxin module